MSQIDPSQLLQNPIMIGCICLDIQFGKSFVFPDGTPVNASSPSELYQEMMKYEERSIPPHINQVQSVFAPQMVFATQEAKDRMIIDLLDFAHQLSGRLS